MENSREMAQGRDRALGTNSFVADALLASACLTNSVQTCEIRSFLQPCMRTVSTKSTLSSFSHWKLLQPQSSTRSFGSRSAPFRGQTILDCVPTGGRHQSSHTRLPSPGSHHSFRLRLAFPWGNQRCRACPASLGCAHWLPDWNSDFWMMDLLGARPLGSGHSFCFRAALVLNIPPCCCLSRDNKLLSPL